MEKEVKKKTEPKKKSSVKILFIIMCVLSLIGITAFAGVKYIEESKRVSIKKVVVVNTGTKKPTLATFVDKWGVLDRNSEIVFENTDKEASTKDLTTATTYVNSKGEEVKKEDAYEEKSVKEKTKTETKKTSTKGQISTAKFTLFDKKDNEAKAVKTTDDGTTKKESAEKGKIEVLKKGITKTEVVTGVGTYEVTIKDKTNKKTYKTTLKVIDKTAPTLKVKESIEITEGDEVDIKDLVESCADNSHTNCFYEYVNDKDEKIDDIDTGIGEREIRVRAYDASKNYTKAEVVKLKVNEKPVEEVEEEVASGGSTGSYSEGRRNYSRGGSSGYSGGNSGGGGYSAPASACASYNSYGRPLYYDAGVNGLDVMDFYTVSDRYAGSQNGPLAQILFSVLGPCNAKYGAGVCGSWSTAISIYCNGSNRIRGIAEYIKVTGPGGAIVGEGWALPGGGVQWISKDF